MSERRSVGKSGSSRAWSTSVRGAVVSVGSSGGALFSLRDVATLGKSPPSAIKLPRLGRTGAAEELLLLLLLLLLAAVVVVVVSVATTICGKRAGGQHAALLLGMVGAVGAVWVGPSLLLCVRRALDWTFAVVSDESCVGACAMRDFVGGDLGKLRCRPIY